MRRQICGLVFCAFVVMTFSATDNLLGQPPTKGALPPPAVVKPVRIKVESQIRFKKEVQLLDDSFMMTNTVIGRDLVVSGAYTIVAGTEIVLPDQTYVKGQKLRSPIFFPKNVVLPEDTEPAVLSELVIGDDVVLPKPLVPFGAGDLEPGEIAERDRLTEEALMERARRAEVARKAASADAKAGQAIGAANQAVTDLRTIADGLPKVVDGVVKNAVTDVEKALEARENQLRKELASELAQLRKELGARLSPEEMAARERKLRDEFEAEATKIRKDFATEAAQLRKEQGEKLAEAKAYTDTEVGKLNREMNRALTDVRSSISGVQGDVSALRSRVEILEPKVEKLVTEDQDWEYLRWTPAVERCYLNSYQYTEKPGRPSGIVLHEDKFWSYVSEFKKDGKTVPNEYLYRRKK